MKLNYYAFALAVAKGCLPEPAFARIESDDNYHASDYTDDMKLLRQEFTWREVGELFGIKEQAAYTAVKRKCN